jgi:aminoglycoside phosphotransferase (APT) family kinase protein
MQTAALEQSRAYDENDLDPGVAALLDRKQRRISQAQAYVPLTVAETTRRLVGFFAKERPDAHVDAVARIGGGASKEQFAFTLTEGTNSERYILRMDPIQTASETDRRREFEALGVYNRAVPAPRAEWLDHEGVAFGQPAAIMGFLDGVTKPTAANAGPNVTGIGTVFSEELREHLAPQYLQHLATIHNFDYPREELPSFCWPDADPYQAARWQLNWWARVWREDAVQAMPIAALAERWLRRRLPAMTDAPVLIHGDFRTGNFLFDEETGTITAVLDWEYAHYGDFHEDLGWMLQRLYADNDGTQELVCGLYPQDSFVEEYERLSGRTVNRETLHWYIVLNAMKCLAITLATSTKAARDGHNHQDAMLAWLGPVGYHFATDLCDLLEQESYA